VKSFSLFLFFFSFIFCTNNSFAKSCQENRLAFDIGSGATKMMVAEVDFCNKKILKILAQDSRPLMYNEDFEKSKDGNIGIDTEEKGLAALKDLLTQAKTFNPKRTSGVATSVFRKAKNGKEIIARFSKKLKISLKVISQEEEAILGYHSAMATMTNLDKSKKTIVWDIGGGSMQMVGNDTDKKTHFYLGNLASVSFKNMIIEVFQLKSIETTLSPNPIGLSRPNAIALARSYAKLHVPPFFSNGDNKTEFIGIGGVHNQSIKNQLQLKEGKYSLRQLDDKGIQQAQKNDADLTGDYRATDVSNILLVQGFMEALGIREVTLAKASLLEGIVLE